MKTTIKNQNLSAVILHKGAELAEFWNGNNNNLIWNIDEKFWNKTSPILFPIVGALKNGEYTFEDKTYRLSRHGFARDYNFEVVSKTDNSVIFLLKSNDETLKIYPFEFELLIAYKIENNQLSVSYSVINLSEKNMFFSIGAHPAFAINGNFEDYSLVFDEDKNLTTYLLDNDLFSGHTKEITLTEKELPLKYSLFENDALVFKNSATKSLILKQGNQSIFKMNFSGFPYLGIWTKKDAPFICLEPWLGIADNVNTTREITEKEGIQSLKSKETFRSEWTVEVF